MQFLQLFAPGALDFDHLLSLKIVFSYQLAHYAVQADQPELQQARHTSLLQSGLQYYERMGVLSK